MWKLTNLSRARLVSRLLVQAASSSTSAARAEARVRPNDHAQLETKFKSDLHNAKIGNFFEAVERVEWNGDFINYFVFDKVQNLFTQSAKEAAAISDRQLALVLSVFGSRCDSVSRSQKAASLEKALASIEQSGLTLGPLSRTAVFCARVDNGQLPAVADELRAWTEAKFAFTPEIFEQFARVYALQGNSKAIAEIVGFVKESGLPVREELIQQVVYSMAKAGQKEQLEPLIRKFSSSMNEVVLRCAVAQAAIDGDRFDEVVMTLAAIPPSAGLLLIDNNKHVLRLLTALFRKGQSDAFSKLLPFIYTEADGKSLAYRNNNIYMMSEARQARNDGLLQPALDIYEVVHAEYKNTNFIENMLHSLRDKLKERDVDLKEARRLADKLQELGLVKNSDLFLLQSSTSSPNLRKVFDLLKSEGKITALLNESPSLKKGLANGLSQELTQSGLSMSERAALIADIATVLFTKTEEADPIDGFKIVLALSGYYDVDLMIEALGMVRKGRVHRELATATVRQIVANKEDALRQEKLEKLLKSSAIQSITIGRLESQLRNLVSGKDASENGLDQAARLINYAFPEDTSRSDAFAAKTLVALFLDPNIATQRLRDLADLLEKQPRVHLSREEISLAKTSLSAANLGDRSDLIDRLKAQNQSYARWQKASVDDLAQEMIEMDKNPSYKRAIVHTVSEVLLKKLLDEKTSDFVLLERVLRQVAEQKDFPDRSVRWFSNVWEKTFAAALRESRVEVADRFWEIKKGFSVNAAISYISVLFLKGETAKADKVCEELRVSAKTINGGALEAAGRVVSNCDDARIEELSAYLRDKLHLKDSQSRRVVAQIQHKKLTQLIESGDLDSALNLAVSESKAVGLAFGQYELFKASFASNNPALTQKVYMMVLNTHDKTIAILDLAFAMLEQGITQHAAKLLLTNGLKISTRKLEFFIQRATDMKRPDILRSLFFSLNASGASAVADLNKLLLQLTKLYYKENNFKDLESLETEVREASFPVDAQLKNVFDMLKKKGTSD